MKTAHIEVAYLDHMGSDLTIANAARVSFAKESDWLPGGELRPTDERLITYLAEHSHWSPFAHTSVQVRVKAPIFVARQLVKHCVGGVWNEVSRRYVDSEPEFYFPPVWRSRPGGSIKQGSGEALTDYALTEQLHASTAVALEAYENLLHAGVAPEQARMVLPQNTMTEWYWTGSLMFFARVCQLRLDAHAQQETADTVRPIADICSRIFPVSWAALSKGGK